MYKSSCIAYVFTFYYEGNVSENLACRNIYMNNKSLPKLYQGDPNSFLPGQEYLSFWAEGTRNPLLSVSLKTNSQFSLLLYSSKYLFRNDKFPLVCAQFFPRYDMKILLGDFNAKVGREDIFKPTIGNESSHEISTDNGVRVVNFATSKNLVVKSTMFPHRSIHKYTWTSPDGKTHNQIDHILIDRRRH
jgi:hypothetical protein